MPVAWTSRLQTSISKSSGEAELRAVSDASHDVIFILRLEKELFGSVKLPVQIYEDNRATYQNTVSRVSKSRLKFVEINLFKPNEYIKRNIFKMHLIRTTKQLADVLTKPLKPENFVKICNQILYEY